MPTLNEVKTNLVNEFYQQDFMSTQEAAAWINVFLDKNCKEVFEKAEKYEASVKEYINFLTESQVMADNHGKVLCKEKQDFESGSCWYCIAEAYKISIEKANELLQ